MEPNSDARVIAETARIATTPHALALGGYHVVSTPGGVQTFDLTGDRYLDQPRRKAGTLTVRDVPSFLVYYSKHASSDAEIFADRDANTVTGILDAHTPYGGDPQWQQHRVALCLRYSEAFQAWKTISGQVVSQLRFAEFIEDHRNEVREPSAADLLELAQTFQATTKVSFKSSTLLHSGQRQLQYIEQIDASAGQRGQLNIPTQLELALPIYNGATVADKVTARLRFRIDSDGKLGIGIVLDQLADVVNAAFEGVLAEIENDVASPILRGTPG